MNPKPGVFRLNGCGIWFLGVKGPDEKGLCTATLWVTILFLPIIPLHRQLIQPLKQKGRGMVYLPLEKQKLVLKEILMTYLYGWIIFPVLIFWPVLLGMPGLFYCESAYPSFRQSSIHTIVGVVMTAITVVWLIGSIWKLKDWDEDRWFGKKKKT